MSPEGWSSPIAILHMCAGALGLIAGALALFTLKGGWLHRRAGTVFLVVMVTTAASGTYMGFTQSVLANAIAGIITLYLLITGWAAVRRAEGKMGLFEVGAALFSSALAAAAIYVAYEAIRGGEAMLGGVPYVVFAIIVSLAAVSDWSVIVRRGIAGTQRIARHLWRMHLGFAAAVGSFFPGQLEIFPEYIREIRPMIILFAPPFAVLGSLLVWLLYVWFSKRFATPISNPALRAGPVTETA